MLQVILHCSRGNTSVESSCAQHTVLWPKRRLQALSRLAHSADTAVWTTISIALPKLQPLSWSRKQSTHLGLSCMHHGYEMEQDLLASQKLQKMFY